MYIKQDPVTRFWDVGLAFTHWPQACIGRLCDIHNRRGTGPQATWPLNYRADQKIMEVMCPCGIGHPTPAQVEYWGTVLVERDLANALDHGCCGCCAGYDMYDISRDVHNVAQAISGRETYTSDHYNLAYELVSEIVERALQEGVER